jgi:hypothetical protein
MWHFDVPSSPGTPRLRYSFPQLKKVLVDDCTEHMAFWELPWKKEAELPMLTPPYLGTTCLQWSKKWPLLPPCRSILKDEASSGASCWVSLGLFGTCIAFKLFLPSIASLAWSTVVSVLSILQVVFQKTLPVNHLHTDLHLICFLGNQTKDGGTMNL